MQSLFDRFRDGHTRISGHAFFRWLESDEVALERRFIFAPVLIDFIMGFADMNKWFLSYEDARSESQRAINQHTEEDRTHSRLFHENWYELNLDEVRKWPAGKVLWWMFLSTETDTVRRFGMQILELAATHPEPQVRFALMEAIEICGDVFFGRTAPLAAQLAARDGRAHRYFGHEHRERETGHLHADENVFFRSDWTDALRRDACGVVGRTFDAFADVLDHLVDYVQRASVNPAALYQGIAVEHLRVRGCTMHADEARISASRSSDQHGAVAPSQCPLLDHLRAHEVRLQAHPWLEWMRRSPENALQQLRSFVAAWAMDMLGYRDFIRWVLRYGNPMTSSENELNRWFDVLARRSELYLGDWHALNMDEQLGWDAGQTIAFCFLSEVTELHRQNMSTIKKLAFANPSPKLRWWLVRAIESANEILWLVTADLAGAAEKAHGIRLDYWCQRHHTATELAVVKDIGDRFLREPMAPAEQAVVRHIISCVFDCMAGQFTGSVQLASGEEGVLRPAMQAPLPPSVVSRDFDR